MQGVRRQFAFSPGQRYFLNLLEINWSFQPHEYGKSFLWTWPTCAYSQTGLNYVKTRFLLKFLLNGWVYVKHGLPQTLNAIKESIMHRAVMQRGFTMNGRPERLPTFIIRGCLKWTKSLTFSCLQNCCLKRLFWEKSRAYVAAEFVPEKQVRLLDLTCALTSCVTNRDSSNHLPSRGPAETDWWRADLVRLPPQGIGLSVGCLERAARLSLNCGRDA